MSVDLAIRRARRRELKTWRSEGQLTRASTTPPTFNEGTGEETPAAPDVIYTGRCQVRILDSGAGRRDVQAGEREIRIGTLRAKFPHDTPAKVDDRFKVTACKHDAGLVNRTFRVTDVLRDEWQVARVALLEEVTP